MSKERRALLRLKIQDTRFKTQDSRLRNRNSKLKAQDIISRHSSLRVLRLVSCVLSLLLPFSFEVFPAEESQTDSQKENQGRTVTITAGPDGKVTWFFGKNLGIAHGNAVVKYEDITLTADHVWADLNVEVIEAQGNVKLEMKDQTVTANYMIFDLKNKKGIMQNGMSFDDPWYNAGKEMTRLSETDSFIKRGSVTSCSLNHPHYSFEASKIVIHIKKELIAKHVIFKIGGMPLLYLPVYRRSLEEDKPARFIFKIGSNTFEGYFVKNILPIHWRMIDGSLFLDYTTRRGTSGGLEFDYDADKVKLREIFIPVPKDASNDDWQTARKKIDEILQRAQGDMDKVWLKQIYIKFQIEEQDRAKAREKAEEVLKKCKEEKADFVQLARRWSEDKDTKANGGFIGTFVISGEEISRKDGDELKPVEPGLLPVIQAALKLAPDEISELVETDRGYSIVRLNAKEENTVRVSHIFLEFQPSDKAQVAAQNKADDILTRLSEGATFEEMAKLNSDDQQTSSNGGDMGWKMFKDLDISFKNSVRILNKGDISRLIATAYGVYILKLEDKEKTPDFGSLAKEYSKAPSAEMGGDIGYKSRWELPQEVRRQAFRLEVTGVSTPIKSDDGYRIVKVEKKRRLGGDVYMRYGELYSYQVEKNPTKLGQSWDVNVHHNQTLWRSERQEYDTTTGRETLRMDRALSMMAELSLAGKQFRKDYQSYQSYTPESELRSYCAFDYYWMSKTGSSGSARFILDGTKDLSGLNTQLLQRYPEVSYRSPNYRLYELQPFRKVNYGFNFISNRIQGKTDFAALARQVSDNAQTKEKGGDLGWFRKQESGLGSKVEGDIFDPPYKLAPGDISGPIAVTDGYQIVKIEEVEEVEGKRERVRARHIFIAIDPNIRTKDEASKLADNIYRKLVEGSRPSLGFPTLNNTTFSFDANASNYFKDEYRGENNIWLQAADASVSLSKRAIMRLGVNRELNLDLDGEYRLIWHSKTQTLGNSLEYGIELDPTMDPNKRDRNVFSSAWNSRASLSIDLNRIFYPSFIPKIYALRHNITPYVRFYYVPPGESEIRSEEQKPKLYPFGPATWTYEQKRLTFGVVNGIDIKTKQKRERISLFRWDLSAGADFTEEKSSDRRYDRISNTFTLTPTKQLTFTTVLDSNPNNVGTEHPLFTTFNSDLRYSDSQRRWTGYLRRQSVYYQYAKQWQQFFKGSIDLRWSKSWSLDFELEYEYDKRAKDIYYMQIALHRMLHCWESRIVFRRYGVKGGYIRRDLTFQIDVLADPGKALGVGYDEATDSWTLRSLPGMGRVGGFLRPGGYSTYY